MDASVGLKTGIFFCIGKAIVGFRIRVREIRNVFKLSQNRDEASYYSIIEQLKKRDYPSQQIAAEMEAFNPFKK